MNILQFLYNLSCEPICQQVIGPIEKDDLQPDPQSSLTQLETLQHKESVTFSELPF